MEGRVAGSTGREITDPDTDLVLRVGRGDDAACGLLLERHLPRVTAVAYRVLGNSADAEDVAQEVFLKVWQHAAKWQPGQARFSTWMHTVTVNLCRDRLRKRRETGLDEVVEIADGRHNVETTVHQNHVSKVVEQALAALPERQRLALTLSHFQGMGNGETALVLGVTIEAVESLLSRARRNLKTQLQDQIADLRGEP
jgi:RNA polymerase sigma-70 factor (ECF subfamily)